MIPEGNFCRHVSTLSTATSQVGTFTGRALVTGQHDTTAQKQTPDEKREDTQSERRGFGEIMKVVGEDSEKVVRFAVQTYAALHYAVTTPASAAPRRRPRRPNSRTRTVSSTST